MGVVKKSQIDYTFAVDARNAYSYIDHAFISKSMAKDVHSWDTIQSPYNLSDHLPVKLELNLNLDSVLHVKETCSNVVKQDIDGAKGQIIRFNWNKANLADFYELTRIKLADLCVFLTKNNMDELKADYPDIFLKEGFNTMYSNFVVCLKSCCLNCVETLRSDVSKDHQKFWWDAILNDLKKESIYHFNDWINAGKPKSGILFSQMQNARMAYKKEIIRKKNQRVKE